MGTNNVRKTKSCVTKSVKGLQRNFIKSTLKNCQFFANISKLRPKQKKTQRVKVGPLGIPYHHCRRQEGA